MDLLQIVLIVLFIIMLIYFFVWLFSKSTQLTTMRVATDSQTILAKTLPNNNNTVNYTYSMWIFVNDWNYRFGQEKVILQRIDKDNNPSPSITLGAMENTLEVKVNCYSGGGNDNYDFEDDDQKGYGSRNGENTDGENIKRCRLENIPLQKWVNIITTLYGRTLDIYVDGKLVRTCVLSGVAKPNADADIEVTPGGGFSGYTTNFQYWPVSSNPQEAYNIYKEGLGGSILSTMLNKFRIKVAFIKDNEEQGSFQI
jgi:hypothetical protein